MPRKATSPENHETSSTHRKDVFFINIQKKRDERNLTQVEMADKLNMRQSNYSRLENGAFPKEPRRIREIAKILGADLNWLFGLDTAEDNDV